MSIDPVTLAMIANAIAVTFSTDPYEWDDWEKHFAWRPTTLDNGTRIWLESYYWRVGEHKFAIQNGRRIYKEERCTILGVLAK